MDSFHKYAALPEDWDGYGAKAPILESIAEAQKFMDRLAPDGARMLPLIDANGMASGSIGEFGSEPFALLNFEGEGTFGYLARYGGKELEGDGISIGAPDLPEDLSAVGMKLRS